MSITGLCSSNAELPTQKDASSSHVTLFLSRARAHQGRQPELAVAESLEGRMQVAVGLGTNLEHSHGDHAPQTTGGRGEEGEGEEGEGEVGGREGGRQGTTCNHTTRHH